jgi:hypothetical protein
MNTIDMAQFIAPKSDQLNADDLIAGPRTITVTGVSASPDAAEQPVSIHFEGDNGKPFKPCKSMRRVMVNVWGADAKQYTGRSMTLYRDSKVKFGGMEVGGIRISHMSHIDTPVTMALTATRAKRAPYRVEPLKAEVRTMPDKAQEWADKQLAAIAGAQTVEALDALHKGAEKALAKLMNDRPDLHAALIGAFDARRIALANDDDPFSEQEGGANQEAGNDAPPSDWPAQIESCTSEADLDALDGRIEAAGLGDDDRAALDVAMAKKRRELKA